MVGELCEREGADPCTLRSVWLKRHSELLGLPPPPPPPLMAAGHSESPEVQVDSNRSGVALRRILLPTSRFGPACMHRSFAGVRWSAGVEASTETSTRRSRADAFLGVRTSERVFGTTAAAEQEIWAEHACSAGRRAGSDGRGHGPCKPSDRPAGQSSQP